MIPGVWELRGAPTLRHVDTEAGVVAFRIFVDLGFRVFREIDCVLEGVFVTTGHAALVQDFAETWCANCGGRPLVVHTIAEAAPDLWAVRVGRHELDLEPPHDVIGVAWLDDALDAQGLIERGTAEKTAGN